MKSSSALVIALFALFLTACIKEYRVEAPKCKEKTVEEMEEFERTLFELRKGVDVVLTFGSYGRDFWWDPNVERTWQTMDDKDVIQYFLPFPLVHDEKILQLSGDYVHAEQFGVGREEDMFWIVVYDPPKGAQKRSHIAFQTYTEDQIHVPSRYVVMIRPKHPLTAEEKPEASPPQEKPQAPPPPQPQSQPPKDPEKKEEYIDRNVPWEPGT